METQSPIQSEIFSYFNEQAPVLFFKLTVEGEIVDANAYAKDLTGFPLIGVHLREVIVDFSQGFSIAECCDDPSKERLLHVGTVSGLPQSFYFTFRQVRDYILVFGRLDAEEIENMRIEVLSLNKDLNNLTRELHKKNAQLNRLNQEKNRFLGMAAHDLRSPIGTVLSYTGFLLEETRDLLNSEHFSFLNTINASCLFMQRLVDDFLDVSAIEAGKFELDLQTENLEDVLYRCLHFNRLQAAKKGIELDVRCDDNLPRAVADAPKIQQAMANLISNAIEHSNFDTTVAIDLSSNCDSIIFSVHDSGPGISPGEFDLLFKPFEKTGVAKTAGEKSTGLGLMITRKIVETHDGQIWVDSLVGNGASVSFSLPIRKEEK